VRTEPAEEGKFQWLARLGFAVRGLLYILVAALVLLSGRTEDLTGALEYLDHGLGRLLLIVNTSAAPINPPRTRGGTNVSREHPVNNRPPSAGTLVVSHVRREMRVLIAIFP